MRTLVLGVVVLISTSAALRSADQVDPYTTAVQFAVTATEPAFSLPLGRDIIITIRRETDAKGVHMGWEFSAADRRLKESPNFFYECRCGHGPHLSQLYAWHFAQAYYPGDRRILPVYGYPVEVRVQCTRCEVAGTGTEIRFASGTVDVGWRRLKDANPRQIGIADLVNRRVP